MIEQCDEPVQNTIKFKTEDQKYIIELQQKLLEVTESELRNIQKVVKKHRSRGGEVCTKYDTDSNVNLLFRSDEYVFSSTVTEKDLSAS